MCRQGCATVELQSGTPWNAKKWQVCKECNIWTGTIHRSSREKNKRSRCPTLSILTTHLVLHVLEVLPLLSGG